MLRFRSSTSNALGTVSTISLAAMSDTGIVPYLFLDLKSRCEQVRKRSLKLLFRVRLSQAACSRDEQRPHLVGDEISRRVEEAKCRPHPDCFPREITSAKNRRIEVDIGEHCIDVRRSSQMDKRLFDVAGRQDLVTPVADHHLCYLARKHFVFDYEYNSHQRIRRDEQPAGIAALPVRLAARPSLPRSQGVQVTRTSDYGCNSHTAKMVLNLRSGLKDGPI